MLIDDDLTQFADWRDLSAAELLTLLTQSDPVRRPLSESRVGTDGLFARFDDPQQVETMLAALRSAGLNAAADALSGRGIDFGDPRTQSTLDALGASIPEVFTADVVTQLKSLGVDFASKWERRTRTAENPHPEPPSEQQVVDKQTELLLRERASRAGEAVAEAIRAGESDWENLASLFEQTE